MRSRPHSNTHRPRSMAMSCGRNSFARDPFRLRQHRDREVRRHVPALVAEVDNCIEHPLARRDRVAELRGEGGRDAQESHRRRVARKTTSGVVCPPQQPPTTSPLAGSTTRVVKLPVVLIDNSRTPKLRTDNFAVSTKPERTRTSEASVTSTSPASRRGSCTSSRHSQGLPSGVRYVRSGKCRPTGAAAAMPSTHAKFAHVAA